jgi:hypothetical protein
MTGTANGAKGHYSPAVPPPCKAVEVYCFANESIFFVTASVAVCNTFFSCGKLRFVSCCCEFCCVTLQFHSENLCFNTLLPLLQFLCVAGCATIDVAASFVV